MLTGIIAFILFLIVCLRFTKKRIFKKLHKPAGVGLVAISILHVILTFELLKSRPFYIWLSGAVALLLIIEAFIGGIIKKYKFHRVKAICAAVAIVLHVILNIIGIISYQNQVRSVIVTDIDLSGVPDGVYIGECNVTFIYAKVEVAVKSGEITEIIILEHRNERGGSAERVISDVKNQQKINVDAVTGATNSSTVLKKAVENALYGVTD